MVLEEDLSACSTLVSLLKELEKSAHENEVYFSGSKTDEIADEIALNFGHIRHQVNDGVLPLVKQLYSVANRYDPCPEIKANGVRSWLMAVEKLGVFLLQMSHYIAYKRKSMFFRRTAFAYKLKIHTEYFCAIRNCLEILLRLTTVGSGTSLICDATLDPTICVDDVIDLISEMRQVDVAAFCGRTQCFHFCDSAQGVAQGILLAFATFSAAYGPISPLHSALHHDPELSRPNETPNKQKSSGAGFLSLLSNPDVLGQQVLWALANFDLGFVKKFWQLGDNPLLLSGADFLIPSVYMSHGINLHANSLHVKNQNGTEIILEPPSVKPIKTRLLSHCTRKGLEYWQSGGSRRQPIGPVSNTIVFQVHGGGFICQSARAQEVYLRHFVQESQVPFFCVDYSLLPDDPFPRAIDEVLFAFCWMLTNFEKLGTTGKHIICMGDSAGGCLLLAMCLRLIELEIRLPDAMLLVYPYACSSFTPSPSRLLALADPIVPIPLLVRCGAGYANLSEDDARLVLGIGKPDPSQHSFPESSDSADSLTVEHHDCRCPETPIPSPEGEATNPKGCLSVPDVTLVSRHRRTASMPQNLSVLSTSKSVSSGLGNLAEAVGNIHSHHPAYTHIRNKSDQGLWHLDLNFRRLRMSESERMTLADLLALPIFTNPLFSPITAPDEILSKLPPLHLVASTSDPLLDDAVSLCHRLQKLGRHCDITVVEGVPHGFLNLHLVSKACSEAMHRVIQIMKQMVEEQNRKIVFSADGSSTESLEAKNAAATGEWSLSSIYHASISVLSVFSVTSLKRRMFVSGD